MKTVFGLLSLFGVVVVLVSGELSRFLDIIGPIGPTEEVYCGLPVSLRRGFWFGKAGPSLITFAEMDERAKYTLQKFFESEGLLTPGVVCTTLTVDDGREYQVQYRRHKLVTISTPLLGPAKVIVTGNVYWK